MRLGMGSQLDDAAASENKTETLLDVPAIWRHSGAMLLDSKPSNVRALDRINLRLSAETFDAIDTARAARPGAVSRNTWITEAVQEKLARERLGIPAGENRGSHA